MNYIIYEKATGEIIGNGNSLFESDLESLETETQGYVVVSEIPDPKTKCVIDQGIVDITEELLDQIELRDQEMIMLQLRSTRNAMLSQSDWTQLADVSINNKSAWDTYRQALRDLPEAYSSITSLDEVEWPQPPQ